jgi:hypothetical protein
VSILASAELGHFHGLFAAMIERGTQTFVPGSDGCVSRVSCIANGRPEPRQEDGEEEDDDDDDRSGGSGVVRASFRRANSQALGPARRRTVLPLLGTQTATSNLTIETLRARDGGRAASSQAGRKSQMTRVLPQ